jgi:hypothetical protein
MEDWAARGGARVAAAAALSPHTPRPTSPVAPSCKLSLPALPPLTPTPTTTDSLALSIAQHRADPSQSPNSAFEAPSAAKAR